MSWIKILARKSGFALTLQEKNLEGRNQNRHLKKIFFWKVLLCDSNWKKSFGIINVHFGKTSVDESNI